MRLLGKSGTSGSKGGRKASPLRSETSEWRSKPPLKDIANKEEAVSFTRGWGGKEQQTT